jgi:hypothetical protein
MSIRSFSSSSLEKRGRPDLFVSSGAVIEIPKSKFWESQRTIGTNVWFISERQPTLAEYLEAESKDLERDHSLKVQEL